MYTRCISKNMIQINKYPKVHKGGENWRNPGIYIYIYTLYIPSNMYDYILYTKRNPYINIIV